MNNDFIRVKSLEGELKLSQVKKSFGCSVTTKEVIFQKPYHSYHIKFEDIIGIIPANVFGQKVAIQDSGEKIFSNSCSDYFKISASKIKIYNTHGIFERGHTDVVVPLTSKFLEYVQRYSTLTTIN